MFKLNKNIVQDIISSSIKQKNKCSTNRYDSICNINLKNCNLKIDEKALLYYMKVRDFISIQYANKKYEGYITEVQDSNFGRFFKIKTIRGTKLLALCNIRSIYEWERP